MSESFLNGKVTLHRGDCLEILPMLEADSIDSCVTDPPYHLTSIVKRFGSDKAAPCQFGTDGAYARASKGFMGKQWDGGDIAFRPELWAEVLRVLKPGAHLLAFGGTRTYHNLAWAIEQSGFEVRDCIMWHFGSGFPKSHNVGKGIDRHFGKERTVKTGIKPGHENFVGRGDHPLNGGWDRPWASNPEAVDRYHSTFAPATDEAAQWEGWGTALKPATEIICLARKPLSESSIAANVLKHGTGGLNIDGCRIGVGEPRQSMTGGMGRKASPVYGQFARDEVQDIITTQGRWPANLIHDGSEEVVRGFPDAPGQQYSTGPQYAPKVNTIAYGDYGSNRPQHEPRGDSGSAARFFYTAKANSDDRIGSKHPTVKPLDLIQYLVRLITPRGGIVLDPFSGTGTAGEAAFREGLSAILIEREEEYQSDIVRRMGLCLAGPDERARETIKASGKVEDAGPLFGGAA